MRSSILGSSSSRATSKAVRRLALVCNRDPRRRASGSANLGRSIADYFARKNVDVHTFYPESDANDRPLPANNHPFKSYLFQNIAPGLLKQALRSIYDVYVIVGFGGLTISLLTIWLRSRSKVMLLPLWHHDFIFHTHIARWLFHLQRNLADYLFIRIAACPIVCQSDYERRSLRWFPRRIEVIPYGINIHEKLWPRCWKIRSLKSRPGLELKIVTSGRLNAGKVPLYFLQVVHKLRERRPVRFQILAARIDRQYFPRFVSEIQRLGLSEVVDIIDVSNLSREAVFALLVQGDVAVCPSYSEAFGVTVVEYVYSGIPVVATRTGVVEHLERNNCLIATDWGDIDEMVKAILKACNMSPQERKIMFRNARHVVETGLTLERFLDALWKLLARQFEKKSKYMDTSQSSRENSR